MAHTIEEKKKKLLNLKAQEVFHAAEVVLNKADVHLLAMQFAQRSRPVHTVEMMLEQQSAQIVGAVVGLPYRRALAWVDVVWQWRLVEQLPQRG
jgi:hypothetical protein